MSIPDIRDATLETLTPEQVQARTRTNRADKKNYDPAGMFKSSLKSFRFSTLGPVLRQLYKEPPGRFLVICRARTGSNFLLTLMDSHPRIRHIWEAFGEFKLRQPSYLEAIQQMGTLPYLNENLRRRADEQQVGFKILYHQYYDDFSEKWGIPSLEPVRTYLETDKDLKVIHLKRRNILGSLVSGQVAFQTRKYIIFSPERRDTETTIELSPEGCEEEFETVSQMHQSFDDLYQDHPLLEVFYEDLVNDTENQSQRLQAFLGVKSHRLKASTIKQNVRPLSDVITNYLSLKQHFADTEWSWMFEA